MPAFFHGIWLSLHSFLYSINDLTSPIVLEESSTPPAAVHLDLMHAHDEPPVGLNAMEDADNAWPCSLLPMK